MSTGPRNPEKMPNSFMRELECRLDDEELKVRGSDLAETIDAKIEVEDAKKEANDKWNREIKGKDKRILDLAKVVRTRCELRMVECIKEVDLANRECTIVRRDTGEAIETRPATSKELEIAGQRSMFGKPGTKPADK